MDLLLAAARANCVICSSEARVTRSASPSITASISRATAAVRLVITSSSGLSGMCSSLKNDSSRETLENTSRRSFGFGPNSTRRRRRPITLQVGGGWGGMGGHLELRVRFHREWCAPTHKAQISLTLYLIPYGRKGIMLLLYLSICSPQHL